MTHSYSAGRIAAAELESITWLPYAGISKSIKSLSGYELEQVWKVGYHTIRTLLGCRNPVEWPTVRMWRGYEACLSSYLAWVIREMNTRKFHPNEEHEWFWAMIEDGPRIASGRVIIPIESTVWTTKQLQVNQFLPSWFGWKSLHESHRIALQTGDVSFVQWPWERKVNGQVRTGVLQRG